MIWPSISTADCIRNADLVSNNSSGGALGSRARGLDLKNAVGSISLGLVRGVFINTDDTVIDGTSFSAKHEMVDEAFTPIVDPLLK